MTQAQVSSVLSQFGYSLGTWIPFNEVPIIFLDQDGRLFTDKKTKRFNFGTDNILRIVNGKEDENGVFKDVDGNEENFKCSNFMDFDKILGFIRTVDIVGPMLYIKKPIR